MSMVGEWVTEYMDGWIKDEWVDEWIPYYRRMNELINMDDD